MSRSRIVIVMGALLALAALAPAAALASGVTNAADDLRTGWYPDQPSLTPQLVSGGTFGQLWSTAVDGQVYAQPLLANGVLLVATENNKVYGLDPASGAAKWAAPLNLGTPWHAADIGCGDLTPNIGVTATPVIDKATNTAYLTHKTYASGTSGPAAYYLDAIDLASGAEKAGFPVRLDGAAQNAPAQTFNATTELQRPGLLLLDGVVYAAFGGHCDITPYQGWIFGVSTSGAVKARWVADATGNGAGIWQSGAGLTSDGSGQILLSTGNGGAPNAAILGSTPPANLGESVARLQVQADGSLKATDFFAPFDAFSLDSWDADFASGGVTGLPTGTFGTTALPRLAVAVGKQGYVYLLNRDDLGGTRQGPSGSDRVVQRIGPYGGVWSRPGVWPGDGGWVYIPTASGGTSAAGSSGNLRVYKYGLSGTGQPTLSLQGTSTDAFGFSSSAPVITSDGTTSGSALVWMIWTPGGAGTGAQLRAYDPVPVGGAPVLRWSAPIGTSSKFNTPGVGAGRLYVGTRDGHVLGFGSPVTPPLTGSATAFPTTTIGSTSSKTVTLTATDAITLSALRSSSSQFTLGTPSKPLPAALSAGQTIDVPVTFAPSQTGPVGGTLTATTSTGKTADFALSGNGQAATAQLSVSPPLVSFGGTAVGGHLSGSATFTNVGGAPLTINAVHLPSAPFGASGAPAVGSTIAPGASVTVTVTFDPTTTGTFSDAIGLDTTGGNDEVGLNGSAGSAGVLSIRSESNDYGAVTVGASATKTFAVSNTGGVPVTITKSKPPTGGAFTATTTLAEGTTIAPGQTLTESVTFTPGAAGAASGTWSINGDDSTGLHQVAFTGVGSVPPPAAGTWTLNGVATFPSAGVLKLTGLTRSVAGSSFFTAPLDSTRHLTVAYDQTIGGGGTSGADGMTLTLADAAAARPTALGASGGGLGYSGIPGIAVAFDTYKGAVDPSANFVGIANGTNGAVDRLNWLATATAIPNLRSAVRHVVVDVNNGTISVSIDGTQYLSQAVTLPPKVLLGFTGATGWVLDNHQVANVVISGDGAAPPPPPPPPPPATLTITNTVNAPSGSSQAAQTFAFSGACPSAFTTAALGNGASASPTLTGAGLLLHGLRAGAERPELDDDRVDQRRRADQTDGRGRPAHGAGVRAAGGREHRRVRQHLPARLDDDPEPGAGRLAAQRHRADLRHVARADARDRHPEGRQRVLADAGRPALDESRLRRLHRRRHRRRRDDVHDPERGGDGRQPDEARRARRRARLLRHPRDRGRARRVQELGQPVEQLRRHQRRPGLRQHRPAALARDREPRAEAAEQHQPRDGDDVRGRVDGGGERHAGAVAAGDAAGLGLRRLHRRRRLADEQTRRLERGVRLRASGAATARRPAPRSAQPERALDRLQRALGVVAHERRLAAGGALAPAALGVVAVGGERRGERARVVRGRADNAGAGRDQLVGALRVGRDHRHADELRHHDHARRALGRARREHEHVAGGQERLDVAAHVRREAHALAVRRRALAQRPLLLALARQHEQHVALDVRHRVDHDVVALAPLEARDAAGHERVGPGAPLGAQPLARGRVEADVVDVDEVRHDDDLLRRHPGADDRALRPLRDGHDRRRAARRERVEDARQAAPQVGRHRPPLGPRDAAGQARRQQRAQQLLLLEVQERDADRARRAQRARDPPQRARRRQGGLRDAASVELRPEVDRGDRDLRLGRDVGHVRDEQHVVPAAAQRLQQVDVRVLGPAALVRGLDGDDAVATHGGRHTIPLRSGPPPGSAPSPPVPSATRSTPAAAPPLQTRVVEDPDALAPQLGAWDALAAQAGRPFCAPAWLLAWWREGRSGDARLRVVLVLGEDGTLVGVGPFFAQVAYGLAEYRLLGAGFCHRIGPLARAGREREAAAAMARALASATPPPASVVFEGIDARDPWPELFAEGWPGRLGPRLRTDVEMDAPSIALDADYAGWMERRERKFRKEARRTARRLEEDGVRGRLAHDEAAIAALIRLHHERWAQRGGSSVGAEAQRVVTAAAAALDPERLAVALLDGPDGPVAAELVLRAGEHVAFWAGGFDPAWAKHAPGTQAMLLALSDAAARGVREADLGGGAHDYKWRMSDGNRPLAWRTLFPRGRRYPLIRLRLAPKHLRFGARALARRLPDPLQARLRRLTQRGV
jgi:CelD/BcsL family acetyltransferase involved in cellulose biosynthesis